jgi:CheY-like chemotaxis protein
MTRPPHILHIANSEAGIASFSQAFARSGLPGVLHGVIGTTDAFLFLSRLGSFTTAPRPKLIIFDQDPPAVHGWSFLNVLKNSRRLKTIPVAILTDSEHYIDVLRCNDLPVDDYIIRPSDPDQMIELLSCFDHWLIGSSNGSSLSLLPV